MKLSVPHKDSQADGVLKVKKMLQDAQAQLSAHASDIHEEWNNNILTFAFTTQGQNISGTLEVLDKVFNLDVKLPMMMRLFEGRIKSMIEEQSKQMLK